MSPKDERTTLRLRMNRSELTQEYIDTHPDRPVAMKQVFAAMVVRNVSGESIAGESTAGAAGTAGTNTGTNTGTTESARNMMRLDSVEGLSVGSFVTTGPDTDTSGEWPRSPLYL
jgi:hypothetical protein